MTNNTVVSEVFTPSVTKYRSVCQIKHTTLSIFTFFFVTFSKCVYIAVFVRPFMLFLCSMWFIVYFYILSNSSRIVKFLWHECRGTSLHSYDMPRPLVGASHLWYNEIYANMMVDKLSECVKYMPSG